MDTGTSARIVEGLRVRFDTDDGMAVEGIVTRVKMTNALVAVDRADGVAVPLAEHDVRMALLTVLAEQPAEPEQPEPPAEPQRRAAQRSIKMYGPPKIRHISAPSGTVYDGSKGSFEADACDVLDLLNAGFKTTPFE